MTVMISGSTPEPQLALQLVKCQHNNLRPMTTPLQNKSPNRSSFGQYKHHKQKITNRHECSNSK